MVLERQRSYNWAIAMDLFLGGAGAGAFLAGFVLHQFNLMLSLAKFAEVLGPLLALLGSIFLLFHAGSGFKTKIYLLFLRPRTSWLSRGTWILSIFVLSALIYALLRGGNFWGWVAMAFAVLTAIYPGFLLAESKAIPFWRTSALPPLFLLSGLSTGLAFLLLMAPFLSSPQNAATAVTLRVLLWAAAFLIVAQLILLWSYLGMSSNKGAVFSESLRLMKGSLFIVGVLLLGLFLPLLLLVFGIASGKVIAPGVISGIFLIMGGFSLRLSILHAGEYLPRYSL